MKLRYRIYSVIMAHGVIFPLYTILNIFGFGNNWSYVYGSIFGWFYGLTWPLPLFKKLERLERTITTGDAFKLSEQAVGGRGRRTHRLSFTIRMAQVRLFCPVCSARLIRETMRKIKLQTWTCPEGGVGKAHIVIVRLVAAL